MPRERMHPGQDDGLRERRPDERRRPSGHSNSAAVAFAIALAVVVVVLIFGLL